MSPSLTPPMMQVPDQFEQQRQIDQLIPAPGAPAKRLAVGLILVVGAVAITVLNLGGYLYPQPMADSTFSSTSTWEVDSAGELVAIQVMVPNSSSRSVRVTAAELDAPGLELVEARLRLEPPVDWNTSGTDESTVATPILPTAEESVQLPADLPSGATGYLVLWVRPTKCDGPSPEIKAPWGVASATFDFGGGAFPPFSPTQTIDNPIWGDSESELFGLVDGEFVFGDHPIDFACEILR